MLIGELSFKTGLSKDSIRFYEKKGLLQSENRRQNRYREFSDKAVNTIHFIQNLKELGFSLREIGDFLNLFHDKDAQCAAVQKKLKLHLSNIHSKMLLLQDIKKKVTEAIDLCKKNPNTESCQTLEKLWD